MTVLVNSIDIEAPAVEVFDYVSDLMNELEWGPGIIRVERVGDGPVGVGTRFVAEWQGSGRVNVEYVLFERPHRWRALGENARMDTNLSGEVVPLGVDRSRFTASMELVPHGTHQLLTPTFLRVMQKREQGNLLALKRTIEHRRANAVGRTTNLPSSGLQSRE